MKKVRKIIERIKNSDFIKNIITLASGNIIGYGINLLVLPIISRLYSQSALGGYDLIISTASMFLTILQLSLILVIMIPKDDAEARRVCKIIGYMTVGGSVALVFIFSMLSPKFYLFKLDISYRRGLILFASYLIFYNLQNIYYSYVNRNKLYKVLFWNPIIMAIINGGLSSIFGILNLGTVGYLSGTILSYVFAIWHMRRYVHPFRGKDTVKELWNTLKKFKNYPLIQLPANLISSTALQLPSQFLGRMFSTAVLGGYTMACKILSVPVSLLATPVNRVYYRTLVEKVGKKENAGEFAFSVIKGNIKIAIIPIGILMIFGDIITSFVLGEEWRISGTYITITGIMYLLKYCSACMSGTFVAVGRQKLSVYSSMITLFLHGIVFAVAFYWKFTVIQTIILYTFFASISEMIMLMLCMYCLNFSLIRYLKFILKYILGSAISIYAIYAVKIWISRNL